jgi:hypothetical protein
MGTVQNTHERIREKVWGKIWDVKLTHYGHIGGSLIGKYRPVHTVIPWIRVAINTIAKQLHPLTTPHATVYQLPLIYRLIPSLPCLNHHRIRRE